MISKNFNLELKGLATIKRPIIHMDFEPMWGEWIIGEEDDSKVFFRRNVSDVVMVGSLHRYTGELIAHNQSFFEKGGTRTAYVKMLCKTAFGNIVERPKISKIMIGIDTRFKTAVHEVCDPFHIKILLHQPEPLGYNLELSQLLYRRQTLCL